MKPSERPVRETTRKTAHEKTKIQKGKTFRKATAERLSKSRTVLTNKDDRALRNIYGKAAWESSPKKVRNPYVHVNSPIKVLFHSSFF